jgi:hypothetical protein
MNTLVFHIGIPKTGSSAIQVFLARNYPALLRQGFDYLNIGEFNMGVAGKISSGNGAFLARCLLPEGAHAKIVQPERHLTEALKAIKASDAATGIISSEMFVDADPKLMSEFLDTLRNIGIRPRVFYFIRAQDQFLMSSYVQQVKRHQYTGDPDEFALRVMQNIAHIRYDSYYRSMCDLVGADNVVVRTFEGSQGRADGLLHSMLRALSISPTGLEFDTPDVNTSISPPMKMQRCVSCSTCRSAWITPKTTRILKPTSGITRVPAAFAREVFSANIAPGESLLLQMHAVRAHAVLKLGAYSRIDQGSNRRHLIK